MIKFSHRHLYILYTITFVFAAYVLNKIYNLSNDANNTFSLIANTSELLGLAITFTEIFVLASETEKMQHSLDSLHSYSSVSNLVNILSQTKEDLINQKYSRAVLRLEQIRDTYRENLSDDQLTNVASSHRKNFDKLNSMITALNLIDLKKSKISRADLTNFLKFLTDFNETILVLKITFKKSIL